MSAPAPAMTGADPDQLETAARELRAAADELDAHSSTLTGSLGSVAWVGGVATRFSSDWHGAHRPRMAATSQAVRDAAAALDRHAAEQRSASAAGPGDGPIVSGTWSQPAEPAGGGVLDDLDRALKSLGFSRTQLELVTDLSGALVDDGAVGRLLDLLTDESFVEFLGQADHVLSVADFALSLVTDFVEHPDLSVDDRIVHALADASLRFAMEKGAEKGVEFLAGALTTTLLPGLGAIFAPVVAKGVGTIAEQIISEVVEAIDDGTDFVDDVADLAVDIWQGVKDGFGLVLDVGGAVVEVVGDAAELVGDLGEAGVELLGDLAGGTVDFAGDLVGGLGSLGGSIGGWLS